MCVCKCVCKSVCVQESGREWERVWGWMCKCVRVHKYVCGVRGGEEECVHIHICDSGGGFVRVHVGVFVH